MAEPSDNHDGIEDIEDPSPIFPADSSFLLNNEDEFYSTDIQEVLFSSKVLEENRSEDPPNNSSSDPILSDDLSSIRLSFIESKATPVVYFDEETFFWYPLLAIAWPFILILCSREEQCYSVDCIVECILDCCKTFFSVCFHALVGGGFIMFGIIYVNDAEYPGWISFAIFVGFLYLVIAIVVAVFINNGSNLGSVIFVLVGYFICGATVSLGV
ncbi:hypothetical protein ADUPG1_009320, partial [Aduncisulcus paluster]